jgi:hypothetical protein
LTGSQNFNAAFGDKKGVFELGRALAVFCDSRPVVRPQGVSPARPHVNHRLHSEGVPRTHDAHSLVLLVVRHVGRRVEKGADAMPAVALDNRASILGRDLLLFT